MLEELCCSKFYLVIWHEAWCADGTEEICLEATYLLSYKCWGGRGGGCTYVWGVDDCTSSQRAKDAACPGTMLSKSCWIHGAAPDQECMADNHIDLVMSRVILDSLQALPGLALLGKKPKKRTVARPGMGSGKKVVGVMGSKKPNSDLVEGGREDSRGCDISSCCHVFPSPACGLT